MLKVGDVAPPFEARDTQGNTFRLADHRGKGNVVVFFYPRAFTRGCTAEVCSFRDAYDDLVDGGTQVVGVSTDGLDKQTAFADKHRLPFPLVGDPDQEIAKSYGVLGVFRSVLGLAKRVTFVIDRQGVVRGVFRHELDIDRHVDDVRRALADLR